MSPANGSAGPRRRGPAAWSPAMKRHQRRVWPALGVYAAVLAGTLWLFGTHPPTGLLRYAAAVAPALPLLGVLWINARYLVEETDEFHRRMLMISMLCALAVILAVTTVYGFLEVLAGAPMVPLYHVATLYVVAQGISTPLVYWRYQ
ncbi:hypothetical protein [Phenylobacterium sp.]|uniref:hypothetical protein n=1 Tax=Phenylobacterium sp. TaxID=1871053 RepID=UPI0011F6916F|nr:hypothetical protein [Phenylobacterium sp.]THD72139.1 MAG: hypothetical protein E8A12_01015 [Phenylobacterium sp.]